MFFDKKLDSSSISHLFFSDKYNQFISECCNICLLLMKGESKRISYSDDLFVIAMNTSTGKRDDLVFESHKKYIDIHLILKGSEIIDTINIRDCSSPYKFSENDDYYLYKDIVVDKINQTVLTCGNVKIILFDDVHKTNVAIDDVSVNVSKLVIKVSKVLFDREFFYGK